MPSNRWSVLSTVSRKVTNCLTPTSPVIIDEKKIKNWKNWNWITGMFFLICLQGLPYRFKNKLFWSWFINVRHYDGLLFTVKEPKECVKFNTFTFSNKCLLNVTSSCNIIWCPVNTFRVKDVKLCFIFHPWTLYLMLFPSDSHSEKLLDGHMCHSLSVVSPPFCNGVTDTP